MILQVISDPECLYFRCNWEAQEMIVVVASGLPSCLVTSRGCENHCTHLSSTFRQERNAVQQPSGLCLTSIMLCLGVLKIETEPWWPWGTTFLSLFLTCGHVLCLVASVPCVVSSVTQSTLNGAALLEHRLFLRTMFGFPKESAFCTWGN